MQASFIYAPPAACVCVCVCMSILKQVGSKLTCFGGNDSLSHMHISRVDSLGVQAQRDLGMQLRCECLGQGCYQTVSMLELGMIGS